MGKLIKAEFIVKGHVQGVGFRYFVHRYATGLGIQGYAKNLMNGNVEVVAEGSQSAINDLHKQLRIGPSRSHVEHCSVSTSEYTGDHVGFHIS